MRVRINGKDLVPGEDFIISPESRGIQAMGNLQLQDSTYYINKMHRIIVSPREKLTWSVAAEPSDYTLVQVDKKS